MNVLNEVLVKQMQVRLCNVILCSRKTWYDRSVFNDCGGQNNDP
jgi:hypothetical protein